MADIVMYGVGALFIGAMLVYIYFFDNQAKEIKMKDLIKSETAPYKLEPRSKWDAIPVRKSEDDFLDDMILAGAMMTGDDSDGSNHSDYSGDYSYGSGRSGSSSSYSSSGDDSDDFSSSSDSSSLGDD